VQEVFAAAESKTPPRNSAPTRVNADIANKDWSRLSSLLRFEGLRASRIEVEGDFRRNFDSLKFELVEVKPANSGLPNTRGSISNLHSQGPRNRFSFLGFWGHS
jgi:hypothetical protein